jgi:hypoxanthine phosphoribosyltransferase
MTDLFVQSQEALEKDAWEVLVRKTYEDKSEFTQVINKERGKQIIKELIEEGYL